MDKRWIVKKEISKDRSGHAGFKVSWWWLIIGRRITSFD